MRAPHLAITAVALLVTACASPTSPTSPAPAPTPTPPATTTLEGTVIATNGGQPLVGALVDVDGVNTTTDAAGHYMLTVPVGTALRLWRVSGAEVHPRTGYIAATSPSADFDAVRMDGIFDPTFFRQLARDGFSNGTGYQPIRRWTQAPNFYVRTVDAQGNAVDARTIDATIQAIVSTVAAWTGGRFGAGVVEPGTGTRQGEFGWTTITWDADTSDPSCGESPTGDMRGKTMNFYYRKPVCGCAGTQISRNIVRHELGHMLGYYHVADPQELMYFRQPCGEKAPSAREQYHAAIVYSRPNGNTDPDSDPRP